MKKVLAVLGLLACASVALAVTLPARYWLEMASCPSGTSGSCTSAQVCTAGTCAGTAPSAVTEGMDLSGVGGFRLTICAASGQTLSGSGTMQAFGYNYVAGLWARDTGLDQTVVASSVRCAMFPDFKSGPRYGRVRFIASGVTVSGGSGLDVLLEGQPGVN